MSHTPPSDPPTQIHAAIGNALDTWSRVELELSNLFAQIADMKERDKALALFGGIIGFEIRLSIVNKLMRFEPLSDLDRATWDKLSARISKYYKKRHQLAHFSVVSKDATWFISPFMTWESWGKDPLPMLSIAQIEERTASMKELAASLNWFFNHVFFRRWTEQGGEPLPQPMQEPPLILRLRALAIQSLQTQSLPPEPSQA